MPLFRRNHDGGGSGRSGSVPSRRTGPTDEGRDWRAYGSVAEDYQRLFAPRFVLPARDLLEIAGVEPGARVLDVGAGTGIVTREVARIVGESGKATGVDRSVGMLEVARREGGGAMYTAADVIDLPFRDQSFAFVVSQFVLHHFTRYETALFDMMRVLARSGRMAVGTWGANQDELSKAWQEVAEEFAEREVLQSARQSISPWEEVLADPAKLKDVLHDAGLRDIRIEKREYRFEYTREDYLASREVTPGGRFLRQMLGGEFWGRFRSRAEEVFADRFPPSFNDFRNVIQAVGHKP